MCGNCGKGFAEAEAVGKEDIIGFRAELFSEIRVSVKDISSQSLGGGNIYVTVFIAGTVRIPFSVFYVFFNPFIFLGIILLDKFISEAALEVEFIFRIIFKESEISLQGFGNILVNCLFKCPQPRRIQMCGCDCINLRLSFFHNLFSPLIFNIFNLAQISLFVYIYNIF